MPLDKVECLEDNYDTCTIGTDPPVEGADYVNLKDFASYQIDGQYHMKMVWSLGESVEWKQVRFSKSELFGYNFPIEFMGEPGLLSTARSPNHMRVNFDKTDSKLKIFSQIMCQQLFQKWLEQTIKVILSWFFMAFHARVSDCPQRVYGPGDPG